MAQAIKTSLVLLASLAVILACWAADSEAAVLTPASTVELKRGEPPARIEGCAIRHLRLVRPSGRRVAWSHGANGVHTYVGNGRMSAVAYRTRGRTIRLALLARTPRLVFIGCGDGGKRWIGGPA